MLCHAPTLPAVPTLTAVPPGPRARHLVGSPSLAIGTRPIPMHPYAPPLRADPRVVPGRRSRSGVLAVIVAAVALAGCAGPVASPRSAPAPTGSAGTYSDQSTAAGAAATATFHAQIDDDTAAFVRTIGTLQDDVARGDLAAARSDELTAQAQFDGFRDLEIGNQVNDASLDELPGDVGAGQTFGGLHAVERDLWTSGPAAGDLASLAAQAPVAEFLLSRNRLGPEAIGTVAVDELGWVADDALAGDVEPFSGLGLVDVNATLGAAQNAFAAVERLAQGVDPTLTTAVQAGFTALDAAIGALGPSSEVPESSVPSAAVQSLTQHVDATGTLLARLAAELAPFGTSGEPS